MYSSHAGTADHSGSRRRSGTAILFLIFGLVMLCTSAPPAHAGPDTRSVSETCPAAPDGRVRFETVSGTLEVSGWGEPRVEVTGTLDRRATLTVKPVGDVVSVRVEWPKSIFRDHRQTVCDLTLHIPAGSSLDANGVSVETKVTGITGAIDVESVSGSVDVSGDARQVNVKVVSGDIGIKTAGGDITAEAVSGGVTIEAPGGEIEGSTVSGQVTLRGGPFQRVKLGSVSGDIEFGGALQPDGRVDISCHSGEVDFGLQGTPSGDFDVSTFSGSIHSDFGGKPNRTSEHAPGEEYHFTAGEGGPHVSIDAFSGTVRLRKL